MSAEPSTSNHGPADPDALARQLHLLYDGAGLSARMDHAPSAARATAAALLDAAPKGPKAPKAERA